MPPNDERGRRARAQHREARKGDNRAVPKMKKLDVAEIRRAAA
jgi:hypothetical protein